MLFSSPVFIFLFLPVVLIVNKFLPTKISNIWLLLASLLFYVWGEPIHILLMIFSSLVNYILAIKIHDKENKKLYLILDVAFNLILLGIFKYSNFVIDSINSVTNLGINFVSIPLPIGISFYTFQTMSYVIDVYRYKTNVQRNYPYLLLYITFFPQLIAGPIVKYRDVEAEIQKRHADLNDVAEGIQRFVIGLGKKMLLANTMAYAVDQIFALSNNDISTPVAWIGALAYIFQIYFDFSGYSDMAIGLGRMFGFHFLENFNYPYVSTSIQEFWRRWHISLSTWFKEYVYIPLGGPRQGEAKAIWNRIVVFFLTGLWHGASWTFVVWGLYNGFFLLLEKSVLNLEKWKKPFKHIYALFVIIIGFTIFRAESMAQALVFIKSLFNFSNPSTDVAGMLNILLDTRFIVIFIICIFASSPIFYKTFRKTRPIVQYTYTFVIWILCLLTLSAATYNPFIYFRF